MLPNGKLTKERGKPKKDFAVNSYARNPQTSGMERRPNKGDEGRESEMTTLSSFLEVGYEEKHP